MKKFIKIFLVFICIFIIVLFFSYEYLLKQIGHFLIYEQKPKKADVIVVLNGRDTERSLAAVDLYNKGYADLIVLARGFKQAGCEEFWKRVGADWNSKIFFQRAIEAMGIPEKSFKIIGDGVTSTFDEANVTKKYLKENGHKSILVVTSKWHSKRTYYTFKSVMKNDKEIGITIYPSKYDDFNPDSWWKNEVDAETVFRECVRYIYYILTFRISLLEIIH
jgi:uncharacterized SAM-binding protein YcdF (DUF218 family)